MKNNTYKSITSEGKITANTNTAIFCRKVESAINSFHDSTDISITMKNEGAIFSHRNGYISKQGVQVTSGHNQDRLIILETDRHWMAVAPSWEIEDFKGKGLLVGFIPAFHFKGIIKFPLGEPNWYRHNDGMLAVCMPNSFSGFTEAGEPLFIGEIEIKHRETQILWDIAARYETLFPAYMEGCEGEIYRDLKNPGQLVYCKDGDVIPIRAGDLVRGNSEEIPEDIEQMITEEFKLLIQCPFDEAECKKYSCCGDCPHENDTPVWVSSSE